MKKLLVSITAIFALFFSLSSFVGVANYADTPGILEFIGDAGSPNKMYFKNWSFTKVSLPDDQIENIELDIEINTSSITGSWTDLVNSIKKKKDYFYCKKFPTATVSIKGATANEDGSYSTNAELTLKGYTKAVPLTFTISDEKPYQVKGSGVIIRQDFGFDGGGPKNEVPISFDATLPVE